MFSMFLVGHTSDTDCDGTSYGAHLVAVPAHRTIEFLRDSDALFAFAVKSEQISSGYDGFHKCETIASFRAQFPATDLGQWWQYGDEPGYVIKYATIGERWNSWVYDDTIGIPALDTSAEPDLAMAGDVW